jgi:Flp pilus assembly protein TadG
LAITREPSSSGEGSRNQLGAAMRKRVNITTERGQTMTEFAVVLPILVVLLFGIIQFGIACNNYVVISDAARAGARKAAVSRESCDPVGDCQNAVLSAAYNLDMTKPGAGVSCQYDPSMNPGTTVTVEVDYPYSIDLFGIPVASGQLKSVMKERLE